MQRSKNKMKGFTLVELLAVIVILAIILVVAVPKVMDVINDSKKATLESTAKMIASAAEKAKVQNTVLGNDKEITCDSVAKINDLDYEDCDIDFDDNTAKVTIKGSGKFAGLNVCSGTKTEAEATGEECATSSETGGCDTLYWDGNTDGLVSVKYDDSTYLYKVSDVVPGKEDFVNGISITISNGENKFSSAEEIESITAEDGAVDMELALIIPYDNYTTPIGFTFPTAGIYFVMISNFYFTSLTIPGYTGFPHSENCGH